MDSSELRALLFAAGSSLYLVVFKIPNHNGLHCINFARIQSRSQICSMPSRILAGLQLTKKKMDAAGRGLCSFEVSIHLKIYVTIFFLIQVQNH